MYHALTIGLADDLLADLQNFFVNHKLHIISAATIQAAGQLLNEKAFHLLIIDMEYLRNIKQTHWISSIRHTSFAPVIVLSNTPEQDIINAVDFGADICISSKWPHTEIAELAHAQFRRYTEYNHYNNPDGTEVAPFRLGDIFIDPPRRIVEVQGHSIDLRPREFSLLLYYMRNPNVVLNSEQICEQAWGTEGTYGHGVAQPVRLLRLAIEPDPEAPIYIHTVRRVGYRFTPNNVETCELC